MSLEEKLDKTEFGKQLVLRKPDYENCRKQIEATKEDSNQFSNFIYKALQVSAKTWYLRVDF